MTDLFVEMSWNNYRNDGDETVRVPVKDEKEALAKAIAQNADFFRTFKIESVEVNGKTFKGEPEDFSKRRYIVETATLYSPLGVLQEMEKSENQLAGLAGHFKKNGAGSLGDLLKDALKNDVSKKTALHEEQKKDPSCRYIRLSTGAFVRLEDGEELYDRLGRRLWPETPTPPQTQNVPPCP